MPAVSKLRTLMLRGETHAIQLKAATEVLDRAGIVATQQVAVDNQVTISVSYQDVELARKITGTEHVIDVGYAELPPGNGHEKTAPEGGLERNGDG